MSKVGDGKQSAFESLVENARHNTVDVSKFTRQIWLAGLGAYAKDDNNVTFVALVEEGKKFEKRAKSEQISPMDKQVNTKPVNTWQKLENVFDERLSAALGRLGICFCSDIDTLSIKLEKLTELFENICSSIDHPGR
ncbi:MAG: phasin family protein [Pseudomonadales bacterium]|nr:phasin family protein [Pseudomonadales bacterium]